METLGDLVENVSDIIADLVRGLAHCAEDMHGSDGQIERHDTNSNKDSSDFEPCPETGRAADDGSPDPETVAGCGTNRAEPSLPPYLIVKACPDLEPYAKGRLDSWHQLVVTAAFVRGMMGISASAWDEAQHVMGPETAAAMLQRIGSIANPGGYLQALSAKAALGQFSAGPMIMALLNGSKS